MYQELHWYIERRSGSTAGYRESLGHLRQLVGCVIFGVEDQSIHHDFIKLSTSVIIKLEFQRAVRLEMFRRGSMIMLKKLYTRNWGIFTPVESAHK